MWFWIYMMIMVLLIPVSMILIGRYFVKTPPKEINGIWGYRTSMSMKNKDTWDFAHNYFGKLILLIGKIVLIPSLVLMLFVIGKNTDTVGNLGAILIVLQIILLIAAIFPTEKALKKNFDKYGTKFD